MVSRRPVTRNSIIRSQTRRIWRGWRSRASGAFCGTECSAKYKAAQAAGSLNGMKWNDFLKAQCGTDTAAKPAVMTNEEPKAANTDNAPEPAATTAKAPKGVVFPKKVDPR